MKILFVSLGCDKNLVDSEKMLGMLQEKGYTFTDDEAEADVVVVNTCCFIGDAKEESINTLLQMGELKDSGQVKALIAAGCLAQRYREEIQKEIPQVDAIIGTTAIDEIVAALEVPEPYFILISRRSDSQPAQLLKRCSRSLRSSAEISSAFSDMSSVFSGSDSRSLSTSFLIHSLSRSRTSGAMCARL